LKSYKFATVRYPKGKTLVVALILWFAISSAFAAIGSINILKGQETENWPSTTGVVVSSYVYDKRGSEGTTYKAKITYQYTLDGASYTSDTISCDYFYSSSDRSAAIQLVENYPAGKIVTIYYNPKAPSESVLIKGASGTSWLIFYVGMFFVLIGVLVTVYIISKNKEEKSSNQIIIILDKTSFLPGETIKGTVSLNLKKQKYAKALKVSFVVNRNLEVLSPHQATSDISYEVYKDEVILDVEREYWNETYPFKIKIPIDIFQKLKTLEAESAMGMQKKYLDWAVNKGYGNYIEKNKWYVKASLDMPKKLDISSKLEINVSNVQ